MPPALESREGFCRPRCRFPVRRHGSDVAADGAYREEAAGGEESKSLRTPRFISGAKLTQIITTKIRSHWNPVGPGQLSRCHSRALCSQFMRRACRPGKTGRRRFQPWICPGAHPDNHGLHPGCHGFDSGVAAFRRPCHRSPKALRAEDRPSGFPARSAVGVRREGAQRRHAALRQGPSNPAVASGFIAVSRPSEGLATAVRKRCARKTRRAVPRAERRRSNGVNQQGRSWDF